MSGEPVASVTDAASAKKSDGGRERSTIAFPYSDLASSMELVTAIHGNVGSGQCSDDQLAPWTKQSPKSSGYRTQVASARLFGLIEVPSSGQYRLSEVGRRAVDPQQQRAALADAFIKVPLYSALFNKYIGSVIPPAAALERDIEGLGVSSKQKGRARQIFERSAQTAGFFEQGKNRLVRPGVAPSDPAEKSENSREKVGGGGGGEGRDHPFIEGLLLKLPKPDTEWPIADRAKWLQTAANIFDLMYKGEGGIDVKAAIANRSPRPE